jgi:hypothetical protein
VPFSAMLDGQRVDLVGEDADDVWARAEEAKTEGRLRCKGCDGELRLRAPMNKSRHFFHLRKADHCPLSGAPESEAHGRAKRAVAAAIRESGARRRSSGLARVGPSWPMYSRNGPTDLETYFESSSRYRSLLRHETEPLSEMRSERPQLTALSGCSWLGRPRTARIYRPQVGRIGRTKSHRSCSRATTTGPAGGRLISRERTLVGARRRSRAW